MRVSFRNGFYAGLLLAVIIGLWLFRLWQPERQITLHSLHLLEALEEKDWEEAAVFIDESYLDQWKQNREIVVARLRGVLHYARNLRLDPLGAGVLLDDGQGSWSARIHLEADPNEISNLIKARVNSLDAPFELRWQQKSGKPWDWKLVRVRNPALELPSDF